MKKNVSIIYLIIFFAACLKETPKSDISSFELQNIQEAFEFYDWLVTESKSYYDNGTGHFGQGIFGYRNVLNECYLRFDGYQLMQNTNYSNSQWLTDVSQEMIDYYKVVADTITTGVWGFPAEINHPEFGDRFQSEIDAGYSKNGWIYELSGETGSKAGIYYVHGQVLADISKTYLRYGNVSLLSYIEEGARWIIEKKYTQGNINYFAAALKGLSYAYEVTKNEEIKTLASYYLSSILEEQNKNGSFGGIHDQEAGYHGITLSCLAVAKKYLPEDDLPADFDMKLQQAIIYLKQLRDIAIEDRAAYVVQAWYYLSCLADDGIIPEFTETDWNCYSESLSRCIEKKQELIRNKTENTYYYQKGIQTFSLLGSTIYKYHYDLKNEFY